MKAGEAQTLFAELRAAFPMTPLTEHNMQVYVQTLSAWNQALGEKAVRSAIVASKFFPSIGELHAQYGIAKEQRRREVQAEQRRTERLAEDNMERLSLREISAVQEFLSKNLSSEQQAAMNLERVSEGKCDDCEKTGARFKFAALALCSEHVVARLRVKAELEEETDVPQTKEAAA